MHGRKCWMMKLRRSWITQSMDFLIKKCLQKTVERATTPFTHNSDNFTAVLDGKEASCASIFSLRASNTVLCNKRKMSCYALQQLNNNKKQRKRQTPNTMRRDSRIEVIMKLQYHNRHQEEEDNKKRKGDMQKEVDSGTVVLTKWDKILEKWQQITITQNILLSAPE